MGKAALFAGYEKIDYIHKLQLEKEPVFDYSENEIDEMILKGRRFSPKVRDYFLKQIGEI